jgi:hypothetical protein
MEQELRNNLFELAARLEAATKITRVTVCKRALNCTRFFSRLEAGEGFTIRTYDRLVQWFSDNWPPRVKWPRHIKRPEPR